MINHLSKVVRVLTLVFCLFSFVGNLRADIIDNKGKDFILSFMPNYSQGANIELHLTADVPTDVLVEYPVNSPTFSQVVSIVPGTISTVALPQGAAFGWPEETAANNAVHVTAPNDVVAYMINRYPFTSDAALALPVDAMNTEYIVTDYDSAFSPANFVVTAAYDNTTVTITPNQQTAGGAPANTPIVITLNKGEGYFVAGTKYGAGSGLIGTTVSSDKPVGLTNGNGCTQVPNGAAYCDIVFEVAQPVATWGLQVPIANLPHRANAGTYYRVLASQDGTDVSLDGVVQGSINRGQFIEIPHLTSNHLISANKAIFVTQFMSGSTTEGSPSRGDPAMGNLVPTNQYLTSYTFATVGNGQFAEHFLTVYANNLDVGSLTLDGVAVAPGAFSAIPGTDFSVALLELSEGSHTSSSEHPHGITVEGYNQDDSYLYPGGALFSIINSQGDENPPLCSVSLKAGSSTSFDGSATDNRPSEDANTNGILDAGEDLNGNGKIDKDKGIFFVELLAGSSNLQITVPAFVPGSGQVGFQVDVVDPNATYSGNVQVTDGAGNKCVAAVSAQPDCAGTPGGSAKLDRCGVCNGDGNSCLQCTTVDVSKNLFIMDGRAAGLKNLIFRAANAFRRLGGSAKKANSFKAQASAHYNNLWSSTWTKLASVQTTCANTEFCVSVSSTNTTSGIVSEAAALKALLDNLGKSIGSQGGSGSSYYLKSSKKLYKEILKAVGGLPAATSSCS